MALLLNHDIDFINELTSIVNNNLSNENFGVTELADKAGLSHSQIHRKLKAIRNQSTSQFIRELRLKKAAELLKQNGLTVSEISYKVGFGSPSYFNKCFHAYFGFPPGDYQNHITTENSEKNYAQPDTIDQYEENLHSISKTTSKNKRFFTPYFNITTTILLVMVLLLSYIYIKDKEILANTVNSKSIAILPLKSLSNNEDEHYLAEGIMEDIQTRLSHIKDLVIKSSLTSKVYKSPQKTLPQIAREMNVNYLIEGSILQQGERVRIYIQLIDAKNDKMIWSDQYDHDLSDIFRFVSNVSQQIAMSLQTALSPEEQNIIKKTYTVNKEAYKLYLSGHFYWQLRGKDNISKSIDYFNRALEIDPNYSLAYALLADSYFLVAYNKYDDVDEALNKAHLYLKKAFSIDPDVEDAHTTLAGIYTYFDYKWDLAEKHYKRALEINPNNATSNQRYSEYLEIIGRDDEARYHIDKALELSPFTKVMRHLSFQYYFRSGNPDKALEETYKHHDLSNDSIATSWMCFMIYMYKKDYDKALEQYKINRSKAKWYTTERLNAVYEKSGIEGVVQMIITDNKKIAARNKKNYHADIRTTLMYAFLNEKDSALIYLEKSYNSNPCYIINLKYNVIFNDYHNEPRFLKLLEKFNLGDYD